MDYSKKYDLAKVSKLYSDSLKKYGVDSRSAGWKDEASQRLRFEKLLYLIETGVVREITVNDLGCGYGALYQFIKKNSSITITRYYGYDISPEMIETARSVIKSDDAIFIESDRTLYMADYSFVSGIFNVKLEQDDASWEDYVKSVLRNLNDNSIRGFAFNALSTYVDYKEDHLFYADPLLLFDYCKKHFSKKVTLLHDYPLYEWTMIVRKE